MRAVMKAADSYVRLTKMRLYAYCDLKMKIQNDLLDVEDLRREGVSGRSRDVVRILGGDGGVVKLMPEEIQEIRINKILREIDESVREVDRIDTLIKSISDEPYAEIVPLKFFEGLAEQAIALRVNCDVSTVYRHMGRLVRKLSVRLYGVGAIGE